MSEATEKILTEAKERLTALDEEVSKWRSHQQHIEDTEIAPRLEERKQLEATVAIFEGKKKTGRGRPARKDKAEEIKSVLSKVGALTVEELAERLSSRPGGLLRVLDREDEFSITEDGKWVIADEWLAAGNK